MNNKAKALLDAHVNFILEELSGDRLKEIIKDETSFIYDHLDKVKVGDVISKEEIIDFQKRNFDHRNEVADPVKAYAKSLRADVVDHLKTSDTTLGDVVDKAKYDELIEEVAKLKDIREKLIHAAVSNPLYTDVIANTLSSGIKSFTSEEGIAGKIPGASSFFKLGGSLLGGISESIDKNVRKFINENMPKLTAQSEKFVQGMIDEKKVKEIGEELWQKANRKSVKQAVERIDVEQFDGFEPIIESMSNFALKSDFVSGINEVVIDHFLKENGGKSIQQILTDIEISKEDVLRESEELVTKIVEQAKLDKTLEGRIRKHLSSFYESDAVSNILK